MSDVALNTAGSDIGQGGRRRWLAGLGPLFPLQMGHHLFCVSFQASAPCLVFCPHGHLIDGELFQVTQHKFSLPSSHLMYFGIGWIKSLCADVNTNGKNRAQKSDISDIDFVVVSQGDGLAGLWRPGNLYR
jgi:hypothetical protein